MFRRVSALAAGAAAALTMSVATALPAAADAASGAIFTTVEDGSEVNFNIYPTKESVYLDGGPGPGAPQHAAGLDDGRYVFQVTDPSGKDLLSTDFARCRQVDVAAGVIAGVVDTDCEHKTGQDIDHNATTVQLMPYLDTTNNGGEYKVWMTLLDDYLAACQALGVANGLDVVNCGTAAPHNMHGFIGSDSKTDNYKVGNKVPQEIDTRFTNHAGQLLDGMQVTWTDTHGAKNTKSSYWAPQLSVFHEAHVEAVEPGVHSISIANQPGCQVESVSMGGKTLSAGPTTVKVRVSGTPNEFTIFIDVHCH